MVLRFSKTVYNTDQDKHLRMYLHTSHHFSHKIATTIATVIRKDYGLRSIGICYEAESVLRSSHNGNPFTF